MALPCWDAVISAITTSSPHVQPGKTAWSIPWASQHPCKPRASIQGGERPLSHSARRESAEGLGLRPDTSAPSAVLLPELIPFPRAGTGRESRARPGRAGIGQGTVHPCSTFPQDPLGRKSRAGWGCRARGRDGREGDSGAAELPVPVKAAVSRRKPCEHSRRAALARGSLMGHKFLLRIVAC